MLSQLLEMMQKKKIRLRLLKLVLFAVCKNTHTTIHALPCCPVVAITLLLPDTDQVFKNTPTLSEPKPPLLHGCPLR